jgi:hypothetical protein
MPAFRVLTQKPRGYDVVAVSWQAEDVTRSYLGSYGVQTDRTISVAPAISGVSATPTVIVVDGLGVVVACHQGVVSVSDNITTTPLGNGR